MNTTKLIEIIRWPSTKRNHWKPWYVILWSLCICPFLILFGLGFYISIIISTLKLRQAEEFRKEWLNLY